MQNLFTIISFIINSGNIHDKLYIYCELLDGICFYSLGHYFFFLKFNMFLVVYEKAIKISININFIMSNTTKNTYIG
jgi:hypothetical protein